MSEKYNDCDVVIRPAKQEDMPAVADMIQELADFEKLPDGPKLSVKDLVRDGFGCDPPAFRCIVAELKNKENKPVVGYALYFPTYSTWQGKSMMMEDLYVRSSERKHGIGGKLFQAVAKEAFSSGCSRLEFHVLEWNDARCFYERRGALNLTHSEQWCYYRLTGEALEKAAQDYNTNE
ncbi:thialysine N-epsilon-acetyltransferase [Leptidea sinapis]|uniref:N-acetyltransferase domain-containing protein n=1 Tax=Leptidea sinapis TaxID=189913 RepID=A0A5E4R5G5_9NEOP|nr:thialysine N-epsilon-acetyltransferase [Leptidea sinapis]VVD05499.1 unnamed protein product [Leptidea sinapis]